MVGARYLCGREGECGDVLWDNMKKTLGRARHRCVHNINNMK